VSSTTLPVAHIIATWGEVAHVVESTDVETHWEKDKQTKKTLICGFSGKNISIEEEQQSLGHLKNNTSV